MGYRTFNHDQKSYIQSRTTTIIVVAIQNQNYSKTKLTMPVLAVEEQIVQEEDLILIRLV